VKNQTERPKWLGGRGFDDIKAEVEQVCFRPESRRGKPIIGELVKGVYIASGHSVWGFATDVVRGIAWYVTPTLYLIMCH